MVAAADVRVDRLGRADRERARRTFELMDRVFEAQSEPVSDAYLEALLARPGFWALSATLGDEVVGGLTAHELPMTRSEHIELFVYDLAVREDRQRRGIGRRLVEALLAGAAEAGIDVTFVPADDADDHALAFYAALGGRPAPVTMFDLGPA